MSDSATAPDLSKRVYDLIAAYVRFKVKQKSGYEWNDFKDKKRTDPATGKERVAVPEAYRDATEKVCSDAFLRMRSCKSREDFAGFFTGTICSVPQFLPQEEYQRIGAALLDDDTWEDVKSLSMLALSGLSRTP